MIEPTDAERLANVLARELADQRVKREARRILDAESRPAVRAPEVLTLRQRLARPRARVVHRIDGWQPRNSRVVLAAQYKAGKTTTTGNVVRCLVDGDPWLGQYKVEPVDGTVVIVDDEMSADQLDDWLADQHIVNDDRVIPIPLRGNALAFDILDPERRREWATKLRALACSYLVLDCLRPMLDALGLNEHTEAGRFLVPFDALLADAGVTEALVVHHMGHTGERSRGDSRIRDWPDVEWRLVRQGDEPNSPRFISAYGRDVDMAESQLSYDATTRRLSLLGGTRREAEATAALGDVLELLEREPGLSGRQIVDHLESTDHTRATLRSAIKAGVRAGRIATERGPKNAILHSVCASAPQCAECAPARCGGLCASAPVRLGTAHSTHTAEGLPSAPELGLDLDEGEAGK